ncbi:MAG TPA: hypothetical protein VD908_12470 [Cytophagales bacterium]|nr:hypothetical protein [Cytophagales bacterium]
MPVKTIFIYGTFCFAGIAIGLILIKKLTDKKEVVGKLSRREIKELYKLVQL